MNTNFMIGLASAFLSISLLPSCDSHEQKPDDAFEIVKEEKKQLLDSDSLAVVLIKDEKKLIQEKNNDKQDEWLKFKNEIENKIVINERKIKQIKSTPNTNAKLLVKVAHLEQDNNDLRSQMDEYKEEEKLKWEKFQAKMKLDVSDINNELKDISVTEKNKI